MWAINEVLPVIMMYTFRRKQRPRPPSPSSLALNGGVRARKIGARHHVVYGMDAIDHIAHSNEQVERPPGRRRPRGCTTCGPRGRATRPKRWRAFNLVGWRRASHISRAFERCRTMLARHAEAAVGPAAQSSRRQLAGGAIGESSGAQRPSADGRHGGENACNATKAVVDFGGLIYRIC